MNAHDPLAEPADIVAEATPGAGPDATTLDEFIRALRDDARLRPGDVFGAFTILRLLRTGGMGEAYLAEQAPLGRLTIVKVIRGVGSDRDRNRFRNEWCVGGELHHTNLVPVYAAGVKGDRDYYVMPYVRGANLREVIDAVRQRAAAPDGGKSLVIASVIAELADAKDRSFLRPWEQLAAKTPGAPAGGSPVHPRLPQTYFAWVAKRLIEAARALATAHRAGVLHLDVKPSNILVETPSDIAKVLDFGLAHRFHPGGDGRAEVSWEPAEVPWYAAPEIAQHRKADCRADVYGLGACLYELVTLLRPGEEGASAAPRDLVAIARKATRPDPVARYQTADAIADDLQRWLDRRLPKARSGWRHVPRALGLWVRRNVGWAAAGAVALALIGGASAWGIERAEEGRKAEAQKGEQAEADKRAAEKERDRIALERRFEKAVLDAQSAGQPSPPSAGWPGAVQFKLREILGFRPGADLRDYAAATLVGLDATRIYDHTVPNPPAPGRTGVARVAFSPDGTRLLAEGMTLHTADGKVLRSPALHWDGQIANKPTESTRASSGPVAYPDADSPLQLILPIEKEETLTLWNDATNKAVLTIPLPGPGTVTCAALSPDARFAAVSFSPNKKEGEKEARPLTLVWAIDRKPGGAAKKLHEWPGDATALAFSPAEKAVPAGTVLAIGSDTGEVVVRATGDGVVIHKIPESHLPVAGLAFGRNYRRPAGEQPAPLGPTAGWLLGVGSTGGGLSVWNLRTGTRLNSYYGSEHAVLALAFSPDGTTLASAGKNHPFIWDVGTGRPLLRVQTPGGGFPTLTEGVAFSPDGTRVAFGSAVEFHYGGLSIFRLDNDRGVRTYRGLTGVVERVWLSPSGKWVAALSQNWQLGVWNRETGEAAFLWDVRHGWFADNAAVAFDNEDTEVLFASGTRAFRWSLKNGEQSGMWELPLGLNDCLLTRPGKKPLLVRRDPFDQRDVRPEFHARELGPKGEKTDVYKIEGLQKVSNASLGADGRVLLVNAHVAGRPRAVFYSGLTGTPLPLDLGVFPHNYGFGRLSGTGALLALDEEFGNKARQQLFRFPNAKRIGVTARLFEQIDDAGKLGVLGSPGHPTDDGIAVYRVGDDRPLVTFDLGRSPTANSVAISPDGHFVSWGRHDGTVCVADVNKCLEKLSPFGER